MISGHNTQVVKDLRRIFERGTLPSEEWSLLEHAVVPEKAWEVMLARRRIADPKAVGKLSGTVEGRKQLADFRKDAAKELETTQTWVNLTYATSIANPPKESDERWDVNVRIESSTAGPEKSKTEPPEKREGSSASPPRK